MEKSIQELKKLFLCKCTANFGGCKIFILSFLWICSAYFSYNIPALPEIYMLLCYVILLSVRMKNRFLFHIAKYSICISFMILSTPIFMLFLFRLMLPIFPPESIGVFLDTYLNALCLFSLAFSTVLSMSNLSKKRRWEPIYIAGLTVSTFLFNLLKEFTSTYPRNNFVLFYISKSGAMILFSGIFAVLFCCIDYNELMKLKGGLRS